MLLQSRPVFWVISQTQEGQEMSQVAFNCCDETLTKQGLGKERACSLTQPTQHRNVVTLLTSLLRWLARLL